MEFILSLYVNIPPNNNREFYEVDWFYKRYIQHKKEILAAQGTTGDSIDLADMIMNQTNINNNK